MDNSMLGNHEYKALNNLPSVDTFLGLLDLKTGSMIISAICVVHPMVYGCTFFMPMSYLILTIWTLLTMFFAASVVLFVGLIKNDTLLIDIWVWYTLVFIVIMLMLMVLLALVYTARKQRARVLVVLLGIFWYLLTVYFVLVVNSHCKALIDATGSTLQSQDSLQVLSTPQSPDPPMATTNPPDATNPKDPDTLSDLQRGKDKLQELRKAKSYSKQ